MSRETSADLGPGGPTGSQGRSGHTGHVRKRTTFAWSGANGTSGAPWHVITTVFPAVPPLGGQNITVPCPSGDVILGGSFDDATSPLNDAQSAPTAAGDE
jgi:hypothetical protein